MNAGSREETRQIKIWEPAFRFHLARQHDRYLDVALCPQYLNRNVLIVTAQTQIDGGFAEMQPPHDYLVEKCRKPRIA